ncbi:FprA family A-type flavoprotein [uncultured Fretibacterium sp.]|uniref:FprA family A-type flavoprotein n=1 Tax=uncultured Fretibacterium sp. TaxID=1678694 RepID=UPI00262E16BF|nr:FprA family A-type flavoprotein [uncultured Fretibacterium sp.]
MYKAILVNKDTWWVGVNDCSTERFEALWSLPNGVAYNAYVVLGEKTAAIDTVKGPWGDEYSHKLEEALGGRDLDYLVVNHMEPDHSGLILELRRRWPDLQIVGNAKTLPLLKGYYGVTSKTLAVADGDTLDLGGHVLKFATIPMVHWPESMVTFDASTGVLFSNDAFGGFGAHEGGLFDDQRERPRWEEDMLRYYAAILGRYSSGVQVALKKLGGLPIKNIFPAHGTLFRTDAQQVVDLYDRWSRCDTERGAVVVYGSMYGNTRRMAEAVCTGISESGVKEIRLYDASRTEADFILRDIWRYCGLALLSCTYNMLLFPPIEALCSKLLNRMPKNHVLGIAGSYSWASGAFPALQAFAEKARLERAEPDVEVFTSPTAEDLARCEAMGRDLGTKVIAQTQKR